MEEAVKRLRQDETSTGLVDGTDNIRTDTVRVASVTRVEDDFSWGRMTVGNDDKWRYWGVYDGHVGWETSSILRDYLANYVNRKLDRLSAEELENPTAVQEAIKSAFVELDDEIISDGLAALYEPIPHAEAMCRMAPANSGSCALMALYDPDRSTLHVAGTGDSRAVLGRRQDNSEGNTWTATVLSVEHTGLNAEEKARIEAEHPGEDMFSTNGRFLSSEVTRSFGDNRRKWPAKALEDLEQDFLWSCLQPKYSNTAVHPGDFLILGTDGFWNHMSNEDAVHCVGLWIEARSKSDSKTAELAQTLETSSLRPDAPDEKAAVENIDPADTGLQSLDNKPEHLTYPYNWIMERTDFVVEQENVATHLVRNAFGGKDQNLFCSLMSLLSPNSKEARDDVAVIVVLFST